MQHDRKGDTEAPSGVRRAEDGARYPLSCEDTIWFLRIIQEDVETAIDILKSISEEGSEL